MSCIGLAAEDIIFIPIKIEVDEAKVNRKPVDNKCIVNYQENEDKSSRKERTIGDQIYNILTILRPNWQPEDVKYKVNIDPWTIYTSIIILL